MHVLVLGAGVVGATTAYLLAKDGARVTVIDQRPGAGQETSAANGGHLSASEARPWATPAVPRQLVRWLGQADAPLRLPLHRWDPMLWRWGLQYLANCRPARYRANAAALLRLARFSEREMAGLVPAARIEFDFRPGGLLSVYRSATSLERAARESRRLAESNLVDDELLDAAGCVAHEPALDSAQRRGLIAGGIFTRDGATGDAARFSVGMTQRAAELGVEFRFGLPVRGLIRNGGRVVGASTTVDAVRADTTLLALGMGSRSVAATAGVDLPLYPVKGYSITLGAASDEQRLPHLGILDDDRKVVYARFADALRAAGTAEFAGFDRRIDERRVAPILAAVREMFPGPFDDVPVARAAAWTGLRPMTPDGPPVLGPVPGVPGLLLNTGHGPLGWTLAAASARLIADWLGGRTLSLDAAPYSVERFRR
jgi:D-amino-acid dehydrogenase